MDDDEISLHLADSDPAIQQAGLLAAMERFKLPLSKWLESKGLTNVHDRQDIISETILAVYERAQQGKLDINTSPKNILFTIAHNKWVDLMRKRKLALPNSDDYLTAVQNALWDSGASSKWHELSMRGKTKEIFEDFLGDLSLLPPRQVEVANALAILFGTNSEITVGNLCDAVEKMTGNRPPLTSIKSAWAAVREKLRIRIEKEL